MKKVVCLFLGHISDCAFKDVEMLEKDVRGYHKCERCLSWFYKFGDNR
jgi:hypothetical protein